MRKFVAPWSSLVWKNSSRMDGSFARTQHSWCKSSTSSASTAGAVVVEQEDNSIMSGRRMGL